ncbi:hypothetical protein H5410_037715 [Solanum commersonii]|uniref:Uncharacterized protein n=1 Tax=Solanum commersonii TaxID=4109 RepID=A0A9J5Y719_SOLCO|nr:hypothetical protein H5410_037715 [Solanum commersonii]
MVWSFPFSFEFRFKFVRFQLTGARSSKKFSKFVPENILRIWRFWALLTVQKKKFGNLRVSLKGLGNLGSIVYLFAFFSRLVQLNLKMAPAEAELQLPLKGRKTRSKIGSKPRQTSNSSSSPKGTKIGIFGL